MAQQGTSRDQDARMSNQWTGRSTKLHHAAFYQQEVPCLRIYGRAPPSALRQAHCQINVRAPLGAPARHSSSALAWGPLLQPSGEAVVQLIGLTGREVTFDQSVVRSGCAGSNGQGGHASATAGYFRRWNVLVSVSCV